MKASKTAAGGVRKRSDGRWEARIMIGIDENGKKISRSVYTKSQKAAREALVQLQSDLYSEQIELRAAEMQQQAEQAKQREIEAEERHREEVRTEAIKLLQERENKLYPDDSLFLCIPGDEISAEDFGLSACEDQSFSNANYSRGSQIPFPRWADEWYRLYKGKVSQGTYTNYYYTLQFLKNYFAEKTIGEIRAIDIEAMLDDARASGKSDSYISKLRGMMFQIMNKACGNDYISKNPVKYADKQRREGEKKPKDSFTDDEITLLFKYLPNDKIGLSIRLMIGTGVRPQEMLALERTHIDPTGRQIHIRQAVKVIERGQAVVGCTKTKDSVRDIPVPETLWECARLLRGMGGAKFIWQSPRTNGPINPSYFRKIYSAAIKSVPCVRPLTAHCCRHTFVTQLQGSGIQIETISALVGHTNTQMTSHYLHVQPKTKIEAVSQLDTQLLKKIEKLPTL